MDINHVCPQCMTELKEGRKNACPHCGFVFSNAQQVKHQLKPFTVLEGKYLVGNVLGEGGFGITYIGLDLVLEIKVAIKEFYPNGFVSREASFSNELTAYAGKSMEMVSKWRDNFLKEARSLAKCANLAGVVGVKDYFLENNTAYIVQEFLEGITLKEYVKSKGGRVSADWLLPAMESVLSALGEVHKQGLIHRDVSPDNIIMLHSGQMKLLDFGAAREFDTEGKSLSVVLKPGYAPVEQYTSKGKQGPWSDIYALAATIYRCLVGMTPPDSMERVITDELQTPGRLGIMFPAYVEQALMKALSVQAENRYQTMAEFQSALYGKRMEPAVRPGMPQEYLAGVPITYTTGNNTGVPAGSNTGVPTGYPTGVPTGVPTGYPAGSDPGGLQHPQEKKNSASVAAIAGGCIAVVLLIGVIVFFAVKLAVGGSASEEQTAKMSEEQTQEEKNSESEGTEAAQQEASSSQGETNQADSVSADVNALETAIFEMNGVVSVQGKETYLELQKPVSVYAYNPQKEAVYLDTVTSFLIQDGGTIGDYDGSGVNVRGAVSIGEHDQPVLQMSKYTVTSLFDEDSSIHKYHIVLKDCTWQEAMEDCLAMGGYLARINSKEEFAAIVEQIEENEAYESVHFYLGGRREEDEIEYYWVDETNRQIGTPINDGSYWAAPVWMEGEPSFYDGDIVEIYMNMFYYKDAKAWIFNDVPEDVSKYYPERTGYICEIEN